MKEIALIFVLAGLLTWQLNIGSSYKEQRCIELLQKDIYNNTRILQQYSNYKLEWAHLRSYADSLGKIGNTSNFNKLYESLKSLSDTIEKYGGKVDIINGLPYAVIDNSSHKLFVYRTPRMTNALSLEVCDKAIPFVNNEILVDTLCSTDTTRIIFRNMVSNERSIKEWTQGIGQNCLEL